MRRMLAAGVLTLLAPLGAEAACTASTQPVSFGAYSPQDVAATDSTGQVSVACTGGLVSALVNYTIRLSPGSAGSYAPRRMLQGANALAYNLYTHALRTTVWGDGSAGTAVVTDGYLLGILTVTRNYPVYGRLPARQNVVAGAFADSIVVTVEY